ncbi:MAG: hypothetical protein P8R54_05570 [Myxococcota bacterium]|nr:hypothetical protein [Myxococcota bacterium]
MSKHRSHSVCILFYTDTSGTPGGFRLAPIRQGSQHARFGFKRSDITHSVNGQPLTTMEDAMSRYSYLKVEFKRRHSIIRPGKNMLLRFRVK